MVQGNTITGTGSHGNEKYGHGMYLAYATDGAVLRSNVIHDNELIGLHINGDGGVITQALIEDNLIYNNGQNAINADGLQSSTIRNNVLYGYEGYGIVLYQIDATGPGKNNIIVNNTIVSTVSGAGAAFRANGGSAPNILYNNILLGGDNEVARLAGDSLNQTMAYNILPSSPQLVDDDSGDASNFPANLSQNSLIATAAQLFVDPAGDFHLKAGSPAINAGTSSQRQPTITRASRGRWVADTTSGRMKHWVAQTRRPLRLQLQLRLGLQRRRQVLPQRGHRLRALHRRVPRHLLQALRRRPPRVQLRLGPQLRRRV